MAINWNSEQRRVIEGRNKNILVSAAAGSGKTAVLTERILSLITDKDKPVDLDRILVVTFTKAAAGEMKERIRKKLEAKIASDRNNEAIRRQSVLIHNAQISTIHSFCSYIIKNYFYLLDIDPTFRIMDDGECRLMKAECMSELFDDAFANENEDMLKLVTAYNSGKTTKNIRERLIELYETVNAEPWPMDWLDQTLKIYTDCTDENINDSKMIKACMKEAQGFLELLKEMADDNLSLAESEGGCKRYISMLKNDKEIVESLISAESFETMHERLKNIKHKRLSTAKAEPDEDERKTELIKKNRETIKEGITAIRKNYFSVALNELSGEMRFCSESVETIHNILKEFSKRFAEKKRRNNLIDYGDLEHFALNILLKKENGRLIRTDAAKEIASHFDYIMIDEYQDSNEIQELILQSVSREEEKIYNRFMVGDIKQSIYGFRHACPELFSEKYAQYGENSSASEVIDLHVNYRSRDEVIDTVNLFFNSLMNLETGGVLYDERQRLNCGASFGDTKSSDAYNTELMLIDKKDPDIENPNSKIEIIETEAFMIAQRIKQLKESMKVYDAELETYREPRYSDFAILVRSTTNYFEVFSRVLQSAGVPAHAASRTGYFSAFEVQIILNYLRLIDNPLQDIALASVMLSPIAEFTANELAKIRILNKNGRLYKALKDYQEAGDDGTLVKKIDSFLDELTYFSEKARYENVFNLLNEIYEKTGILAFAAAMPAGIQRAANLKMLLQKAAAFEKTSYSGVFNFVRYIDEIESASEDFGEANIFSDNSDSVRIMTIHKSKGLEFPVVFVSGINHKFNFTDMNKGILIHKNLGIGIDAVDYDNGKKKKGFYKKIISSEIKKNLLQEELRILYVAMTRAKEKLIFTGVSSNLENQLVNAMQSRGAWENARYSFFSKTSSYLEWLLPVLASYSCFRMSADYQKVPSLKQKKCDFIKIKRIAVGSVIKNEADKLIKIKDNIVHIAPRKNARIYDEKIYEILKDIGEFDYKYRAEANIPEKITVSVLKSMQMENEDDDSERLYKDEEIIPYMPGFMQEDKGELTGAMRGTAYHKVFRYIDYSIAANIQSENDVRDMLDELLEKSFLTKEERAAVYSSDIFAFIKSDIGNRMMKAALRNELYREQPFTMQVSANEVRDEWKTDEPILVQGIIDAYFIENGDYILVDYKTDYIPAKNENILRERYALQLKLYARALEKSTGKRVRESMIYSTMLRKCVNIN